MQKNNNENLNLKDLISYIENLLANGGEKLKALKTQLTQKKKTLSAYTLIIGAENRHLDNETTVTENQIKTALTELYNQYKELNLSALETLKKQPTQPTKQQHS